MGQPPKCPELADFDQPRSPFDTGSKTPIQGFPKTPRGSVSRVPAGISHDGFQDSPRGSQGNSSKGIQPAHLYEGTAKQNSEDR